MTWTEQDIPDQTGRTAVITGANSGLGLRAAHVLAEHGARVILACRSAERGAAAAETVGGELVTLDVSDLTAVRRAAVEIRDRTGDRLDLLVNNAGITGVPLRRTTDGFESQFATNHLGHAALTWLLMPALRGGRRARVVHVASLAARTGGLDLADPNFERRPYRAGLAYGQSKMANLLFALELDRRLRAAGDTVRSLAAHPGMSNTELFPNAARDRNPRLLAASRTLNAVITQSAARGTLPVLFAATAPEARGYYGPRGPLELAGAPAPARVPRRCADEATARELWDRTAELTGIAPDPAA